MGAVGCLGSVVALGRDGDAELVPKYQRVFAPVASKNKYFPAAPAQQGQVPLWPCCRPSSQKLR